MDQKELLQLMLTEIKDGKITEANIEFIKKYSNDKSAWLSSVTSDQLLIICEKLQHFICTSGTKALNLQVMILVLESYSLQKSVNSVLLLQNCLPAICEYLEIALQRGKEKTKEREKSALRKILSSLTNLQLPFTLFPKSLLKKILLSVINDVSDRDEYCLLFLLSLPKSDAAWSFFVEMLFDIIEGKTGKFKKTFKVDDTKLPMQFLFLIAYTQGSLSEDNPSAYEQSFRFTAHFVDSLYNKCCDNQHFKAFMIFAENYLTFLISLGNDPVWPVVPFILQLITKNIFCKLIEPKTNVRLQSFLIKQIPIIAERLKSCEKEKTGDFKPLVLKMDVIAYVETLSRDYIKGDIAQAYKNLWSKFLPGEDEDEYRMASREDAARAATILHQLQEGYATSIECLKLLLRLKCSDDLNKMVKTDAVKALGKVILLEPTYLAIPKVQAVFSDCLASLTANGRVSICSMLATFLAREPAITEKFVHDFMILLNDDAFSVRRAAINTVADICCVDYFHGMENLSANILRLFHDPEFVVQSAVLDYFYKVFVKRVNHLGCLVEINVSANIRTLMVPILKKLNGKDELIDELAVLAEAVVLYLKTNSVKDKKLAAGVVLDALGQVYPACLKNQLPDIVKLSFCNEPEPYLMKKLCSVLISTSEFIRQEDKVYIYKKVQKKIPKQWDWNKPSPCVFKMLSVLKIFATEDIFFKFIQPSLKVLTQARNDDSSSSDILLPLAIVGFLWKDYENYEDIVNLLIDFLKKPAYQMTAITALTEARFERVPEKTNPVLNSLIDSFIRDKTKPLTVVAGLKYLSSCLIGDAAKYEKPAMKQLGDTTTASLSQLLQETLQAVLACSLSPNPDIRRPACGVIRQIVESGLLLRSHFIPYLVAMTADDCSEIRHAALESLKRMPETEVALFAIDGVRLAYTLRKVLHPDLIQRGVIDGHSVCCTTFELIRAPAKARKLLESLVTEAGKKNLVEEVVFFLDNVVFYPFKTVNEVGHVVEVLEKLIFEYRRRFQCRLFEMARKCLTKMYKISDEKWCKDKLQRVKMNEYLTPFISDALVEENGEESAMALLTCLLDGDFEEEIEDGQMSESGRKSRRRRSSVSEKTTSTKRKRGDTGGKKRKSSVKARKRLSFTEVVALGGDCCSSSTVQN